MARYSTAIGPKTGRRLVLHLMFWIAVQIALPIIHSSSIPRLGEDVITSLLFLPYNMALVYVALYWMLPPALAGNQRVFIRRLWLYGVGSWLLNFLYRAYVLIPYRTGKVSLFPNYHESITIGAWIMGLIIVGAAVRVKLYLFWQEREQANQQLVRETVAVELQLLKAQVHPHFLFNTLNNLYSLILKQSPQATYTILKLSGLLQYMIYECNAPTVLLSREISFLQNYIELEKLRYGSRLSIDMHVEGDVRDKFVAPLLLIPFLENAFKHGSSKQIGAAQIELRLTMTDDTLLVHLENSREEQPILVNHPVGGLGLANVRKRLELLYPDAYTLTIQPEAERFRIDLTIQLNRPRQNPPPLRRFIVKQPVAP